MADVIPSAGADPLATEDYADAGVAQAARPPLGRVKLEGGKVWLWDVVLKKYIAIGLKNKKLVAVEA
jgi:hypothetical protein